jgi:hypothetical protein
VVLTTRLLSFGAQIYQKLFLDIVKIMIESGDAKILRLQVSLVLETLGHEIEEFDSQISNDLLVSLHFRWERILWELLLDGALDL